MVIWHQTLLRFKTNTPRNGCIRVLRLWVILQKASSARVFAHNGSRFDYSPFVEKIGHKTKKDPDVIFDSSSIICIKVFEKCLIFMDSFRFLPMRLADMPTTFGVSDVAKGSFLHRLNTQELWGKCIPKPAIEDLSLTFCPFLSDQNFWNGIEAL